jgi:hypothetical protein
VEIFAAAGVIEGWKACMMKAAAGFRIAWTMRRAANNERHCRALVRGKRLRRLRVVGATLPITGAIYRNGRGLGRA